MTRALPVVSVQTLLELSRALLALADGAGAHAALDQAEGILRHRPDLGTLNDDAAEIRAQLDTLRIEMIGVSSLTTAELRLLPLLPTHLSLAEISDRLFVSRNTVKSQAISIYRKFGVSTRGATIERMREIGLYAPG